MRDVLERIETWPESRQDAAAEVLIEIEAQATRTYRLTPEARAEVRRRRANPNRKLISLEEARRRLGLGA